MATAQRLFSHAERTENQPEHISVNMYDSGITYKSGRWTAEAEYLYKHYTKDAFRDVNAFDGFICYDLPLKKYSAKSHSSDASITWATTVTERPTKTGTSH